MEDKEAMNRGRPGESEPTPTSDIPGPVKGPGDRIGPFRIERELGHGGAGIVYLARDTKLDRHVAIKSLPPQFAHDVKTQARFQREARLLASLNHPNIATIHEELEEAEGQTYLVLEYVPGETLGQRIARGPIALKDALAIALEIAEAMAAAHAKGVIHRDLKPENIKITPEGRTKVLDFGIAKMVGAASAAVTITEPGHVIGTPGYMSPEQARGEPADHRTDIWSFGCVLYEALAGRCAFPGQTATEALASILKTDPDWAALPPQAASCVRDVLAKCLRKDPSQRYPSAATLQEDLRKCQNALFGTPLKALDVRAAFGLLRRPRIAAVAVLTLLLLGAGVGHLVNHSIKVRWARLEALPQISELIKQEQYRQAFVIARRVERYIPDDPVLKDLWPQLCKELSVVTEPSGARIYYRDYADSEGNGEYLGTTPLEKVRHPLGIFRWRFEKEGHETREAAMAVYPATETLQTILLEPKNRNPGMLPVRGDGVYWIDRYEVTNAQFQQFVDANGYNRRELWTHKFIEDGNELSWKEAMDRFIDRTGKPGPATWEWGTFPEGQDSYPVGGVSWYEAAAYAQWAGKDLPVLTAWEWAADLEMRLTIMADSNIGFKQGPAPVGKHKGMGRRGLYDVAGNVKEWCWNATDESGSRRYIRGGAWADSDYVFDQRDHQPPMSRQATFGFRCAHYTNGLQSLKRGYTDPVSLGPRRDYDSVEDVSDEEFAILMRDTYGYTPSELNDSSVVVEDGSRHWRKERIEFDAAYDNERITAYLFLPRGAKPPYQPVVYFPGVGVMDKPSSQGQLLDFAPIEFVVKSGRAVLYPIYKGTYERRFLGEIDWPKWTAWVAKDVGRSIDYLEKRARERGDIDMDRLTYYGLSIGVCVAPILLAVEDRIKSAVLMAGGFLSLSMPERMDGVRFAHRVKIPVLMVNGTGDPRFPIETSVKPMFNRLGTAEPHKRLILYDGGHSAFGLFYWQIQKDVISWLDKYPGSGN